MTTDHRSGPKGIELPLSAAQLGVWFAQQLDPQNAGFNVGEYLEIHGPIDPALFEAALRRVVLETEALCISLVERAGEPRQIIAAPVKWSLPFFDMSGDADPAAAALSWMNADIQKPIDLLRSPLFAFALVKAAADRYLWYARYHHIAFDGLSRSLIARRVADVYTALAARSLPDGKAPGPLAAIVADDAAYRASDDFARDRQYWIDYLAGAPDPTSIAGGRFVKSSGLRRQTIHLHAPGTAQLRVIGRLSRIITAATAILVHHLTRAEDIMLGLAAAARSDSTRNAAGMAANILPFRLKVNPDARVGDFVTEIDRQIRAVLPHQRYRFTDLRRDLHRIKNDRPIFTPVVNIQPFDYGFRFAGVPVTLSNLSAGPVEDLTIIAYDHPGTADLRIDLDANPALYNADVLAGHGQHLLRLLEAMVDPDATIAHLDMLAPDERHQVLVEWNQTEVAYPRDKCTHQLFEAQAERTPDAVAVIFDQSQFTYAKLDSQSNQLAGYLCSIGAGSAAPVGICLERSFDQIVAILAVLKSGGAFLPLDPAWPEERLRYILADARAPVVIATNAMADRLASENRIAVVLDRDAQEIAQFNSRMTSVKVRRENLAYVIYTSGSTGKPKGVEITHGSLLNLIYWHRSAFDVTAADRASHLAGLGFDASVWEVWPYLTAGASISLANETVRMSPDLLRRWLLDEKINIAFVPTALAEPMLAMDWPADAALRFLLVGADTLHTNPPPGLPFTLVNNYGPTECTVVVTSGIVPAQVDRSALPSIGRPISNTKCYILDSDLQPVPIGVRGELFVAGDGLARGYLNDPKLTAEKFIPNPLLPNSFLYRTGDFARYRSDGNIEFLGRLDQQVKMRGHRIELGEIETVLKLHPSVREAVVVAREDVPGDKRLVAYVTPPSSSLELTSKLHSLLKGKLPNYMVPSAFVFLEAFPLTPNGKLDRKALPPPERQSPELDGSYVAARTPTEEVLAGIWSEILNLKQVGIHDNFFELGGHSLLVFQLINEINRRLNVTLHILDVFQNPTLEQQAILITKFQTISKEPEAISKRPAVVRLKDGNAEPSVYFVYAGPDEFRLAQHISEGIPVFGIEVPWPMAWRNAAAKNERSALPNMDELVGPFLTALRTHAGFSPCVVAGHSFAGLLAFELAHQFQRQGGNVEMVMLFDAWAIFPTARQAAWHNLREAWKSNEMPHEVSVDQLPNSISSCLKTSCLIIKWMLTQEKNKLLLFAKNAVKWQRKPAELTTLIDEHGVPISVTLIGRLISTIRKSYRPQPLNTKGVLFRTNDTGYLRAVDRSLGWKNMFTGGLESISVTGDHLSIARQESNPSLDQAVKEVIKAQMGKSK